MKVMAEEGDRCFGYGIGPKSSGCKSFLFSSSSVPLVPISMSGDTISSREDSGSVDKIRLLSLHCCAASPAIRCFCWSNAVARRGRKRIVIIAAIRDIRRIVIVSKLLFSLFLQVRGSLLFPSVIVPPECLLLYNRETNC